MEPVQVASSSQLLSVNEWIAIQTQREADRSWLDRWLPLWERIFGGTSPSSANEIEELEAMHRWCTLNIRNQADLEAHQLFFRGSQPLRFLGNKRVEWLDQKGQQSLWQAFWRWWRGETLEEVYRKADLLCSVIKVIHQADQIFEMIDLRGGGVDQLNWALELPEYFWHGTRATTPPDFTSHLAKLLGDDIARFWIYLAEGAPDNALELPARFWSPIEFPTVADFDQPQLGCRSFLIGLRQDRAWVEFYFKEVSLDGSVQVAYAMIFRGSDLKRALRDHLGHRLAAYRLIDEWNSLWRVLQAPLRVECLANAFDEPQAKLASNQPEHRYHLLYSPMRNRLYFRGLSQLCGNWVDDPEQPLQELIGAAEWQPAIGQVSSSIEALPANCSYVQWAVARQSHWMAELQRALGDLADPPPFLRCLVWEDPFAITWRKDLSSSFTQETSGCKRLKLFLSFERDQPGVLLLHYYDPTERRWKSNPVWIMTPQVLRGDGSLSREPCLRNLATRFAKIQGRWTDWLKRQFLDESREQFKMEGICLDNSRPSPYPRHPWVCWRGIGLSDEGILSEGSWHYFPSIYFPGITEQEEEVKLASLEPGEIARYAAEIALKEHEGFEGYLSTDLKSLFERYQLLSWTPEGCLIRAAPGLQNQLRWDNKARLNGWERSLARQQQCLDVIKEQQKQWIASQLDEELRAQLTQEQLGRIWYTVNEERGHRSTLHPNLDRVAWEAIGDRVRRESYLLTHQALPAHSAEKWIREVVDAMHRPNLVWQPPTMEGALWERATVVVDQEGGEQRYLRFWLCFEGEGQAKRLELYHYMSSGEVCHSSIWTAASSLSATVQKLQEQIQLATEGWKSWSSIEAAKTYLETNEKIGLLGTGSDEHLLYLEDLLVHPYVCLSEIDANGCFSSSQKFIHAKCTLDENGWLVAERQERDSPLETEELVDLYKEERQLHIERIQGPLTQFIKKQLDSNLQEKSLSVVLDPEGGWHRWQVVLGDNEASCSLSLPLKADSPQAEEAAEEAYDSGLRRAIEELNCQASGGCVAALRQRWTNRFLENHHVERWAEGTEPNSPWESAFNDRGEVRLFYRWESEQVFLYYYSPNQEKWERSEHLLIQDGILKNSFENTLVCINRKWILHLNALKRVFIKLDYAFFTPEDPTYTRVQQLEQRKLTESDKRKRLYKIICNQGAILETKNWFLGREGGPFAHQLTWDNPFTESCEKTSLPPLRMEVMKSFCRGLKGLEQAAETLKRSSMPYCWRGNAPLSESRSGFNGISVGLDNHFAFYYSVQFCGDHQLCQSVQEAMNVWRRLSLDYSPITRYFLETSYAAPELILPEPSFLAHSITKELGLLRLRAENIRQLLSQLAPKSRWALFTHLAVAVLKQPTESEKRTLAIELDVALSSTIDPSWDPQKGDWHEDLSGRDQKLVDLYCTRCLKPPAELLSFWDRYFLGMEEHERRHGASSKTLAEYRRRLKALILGDHWQSAVPVRDRTQLASKIKIVLATLAFKAYEATTLVEKGSLIGQLISLAEALRVCEAAWATAVMELHETVDLASDKSLVERYFLREGDKFKRALLTKLATGNRYDSEAEQSQHIYCYLVESLRQKGYQLPSADFRFDDNHSNLGRADGLDTPEKVEAAFIEAATPQELLIWFYPIVNELVANYHRLGEGNKSPKEREEKALLYQSIEELLLQSASEKLVGEAQRVGLAAIEHHWKASQSRRKERSAIEKRYDVVKSVLQKVQLRRDDLLVMVEEACKGFSAKATPGWEGQLLQALTNNSLEEALASFPDQPDSHKELSLQWPELLIKSQRYTKLMRRLTSIEVAIQRDHGATLEVKRASKREALLEQLRATGLENVEQKLDQLLAQLDQNCYLDLEEALTQVLAGDAQQPAIEPSAELKNQLESLARSISHYHALSKSYALGFVEWMKESRRVAEEALLATIQSQDRSVDDKQARAKMAQLQALWHRGPAASGSRELQSWQGEEERWITSYHRDCWPTEPSLLTTVEEAIAEKLGQKQETNDLTMERDQQKLYLMALMQQAYFVMEEEPISSEERTVAIRRQGLVALLKKLQFLE